MKIEDIRLTEKEMVKAITPNHILAKGKSWGIVGSERDVANTATDKANRWWVDWIEKHSILERCDPDVMPYFIDYLAVDYPDWQALKKLVKDR